MLEYEEFEAKILADAKDEVEKCKKQLRFAEHNLAVLVKCHTGERNKI